MNKSTPAIAMVALLTLALLALYNLLLLQYESGDAYPPFSSFRADPLGTLVLHEALHDATRTPPQRNLAPLDHAPFPPDTTLLLAGAGVSRDEVATLERIESHITAGGRFVILFRPGQSPGVRTLERRSERKDREEKEASGAGDGKTGTKKKTTTKESIDDRAAREQDMAEAIAPTADISERWGFGYSIRDLPRGADKKQIVRVTRSDSAPPTLPADLPWHSDLILTGLAPEWTVLYERDAWPVVIEREWGRGRIVIATDNYLVTNEAMLHDRAPAFLAWLAGPGRSLVFEETHLGVVRSTGVMTLVRRYGLIPLLAAAILLTLLFIWRNAAPLVPKRSGPRAGDATVAAQSTIAGLANLARRAIPPRDVLESCWRLYQAPAIRKAPLDPTRRAQIESVLAHDRQTPTRRRQLTQTYNLISAIINEGKPKP